MDLIEERERAIKEQTPMRIQECRVCNEILPIEDFTKSGKRKYICRVCSRKRLEELKELGIVGGKGAFHHKYDNLKEKNKKRGFKTTISFDEFEKWFIDELKDNECFYCKRGFDIGNPMSLRGVTVDRVDNTLGYELGNLVLACRRCNIAKGNWFSFENMLEIAEKYLKEK